MKRVIFCIIGWVLVLGLHAQIVENMRIYTDKDCYVAGEDLWIKVCVTDSLSRGSVLSKVAYVEISDTKLVYAQGKIDLQNGNGWGRIRLPQVMHTGAYQLTAYTRYMRNYPMACFPKKYIACLILFRQQRRIMWNFLRIPLPFHKLPAISFPERTYGQINRSMGTGVK